MYISVTQSRDGEGLQCLHIDDILFLETSQNRILVHTHDAVYYVANTLERWMTALQSAGHQFELVDRGYLADLSKVKRTDPDWSRLFFIEEGHAGAKPCNVARANFKRIVRRINELSIKQH